MVRGRSGLSSAAVLLVIVALTGKLAFLTLSKTQLQSADGALSLLQVRERAVRAERWCRECRENQHRQHIPPESILFPFPSLLAPISSPLRLPSFSQLCCAGGTEQRAEPGACPPPQGAPAACEEICTSKFGSERT